MPSSSILLTRLASVIARRRLGEMLLGRRSCGVSTGSPLAIGGRRRWLSSLLPRPPGRRGPPGRASGSRRRRRSSRWRGTPRSALAVGDVDVTWSSPADCHLAGDGALPDQLVEPQLVARQGAATPAPAGGDRSVGRIASCASWAFLAVVCIRAARRAGSSAPYCCRSPGRGLARSPRGPAARRRSAYR